VIYNEEFKDFIAINDDGDGCFHGCICSW